MPTTAEIVNFAEQRELRRIQSEVMHANRRIELAHIRLACGVWPSNTETRNAKTVN